MLENVIERRLVNAVKESGGVCLKFTSPGNAGVPDRICLREGRVVFVECKAPGKKPRPVQELMMTRLRKLGFKCFVLDSVEGIDEIVRKLRDE